jgi:hypothetical protein
MRWVAFPWYVPFLVGVLGAKVSMCFDGWMKLMGLVFSVLY